MRDLPRLLRAGDVLVFNDTRVIPAQLEGRRGEARIGATLHKRLDLRRWQAFVRNAKRLREGDTIEFAAGVAAIAEQRHADGSWTLAFAGDEPVEVLLERAGHDAAAALHRRQARRPTRPTATTTRRCSRARTARSPRRPPRCTSRPNCSPRSTRPGSAARR